MRRTSLLLLSVSIAVAACGTSATDTSAVPLSSATGSSPPPPSPTTTARSPSTTSRTFGGLSVDYEGLAAFQDTTTSTTSAASTSTTMVVLPPEAAAGPDFVWYGGFGLIRVEQGFPTVVWDQGTVEWADDDLSGGVLYRVYGQPTLLWQRAGDSDPVEVEREVGDWYPEFTGDLDGVPTLFYSGLPVEVDTNSWLCPPGWALNGYALATGKESTFVCLPIEDAGFDIYSFGGGRFVGTPYGQCGGDYTYHSIKFWATSGTEVEVASNPFPPDRDCAPCELAGLLSDDGTLLAYRYRPDAFWPGSINYPSGHLCNSDHDDFDGWWENSRLVPAVVAVVDLTTGEEIWSTEVGADVQLDDFDGRYVVLHRRDRQNHPHVWVDIRIIDTWGEHTDIHIDNPSMEIRSEVKLIGRETP